MKIEYTIEVSWTHQGWTDQIEIDDEDVEGLSDDERDRMIEEVVNDAVGNVVSWGWEISDA
jgi:hypothetical protein